MCTQSGYRDIEIWKLVFEASFLKFLLMFYFIPTISVKIWNLNDYIAKCTRADITLFTTFSQLESSSVWELFKLYSFYYLKQFGLIQ